MDKKKIEDFGTFCTLIANEPENVWNEKGNSPTSKRRDDAYLYNNFITNIYYHIPAKKRKTMAKWYGKGNGQMYVLDDTPDGYRNAFIKLPNSEFEVDEDASHI